MKKILIIVGVLIACSMAGTLKDNRDGKTYKTVKIGNQVWMAENLNYMTSGSVCYDYKDANCKKYGRFYTWGGAQNACPAGWHLPTKEEWGTLLRVVGDENTAGRALKSRRGWKGKNGNGLDSYGFSVLPAGYYVGNFSLAGYRAYFWSASQGEDSSRDAYGMSLNYDFEDASMGSNAKTYGFSVRCLQNSNEERDASLVRPSEAGAANKQNQESMRDSRDGKIYKTVKIGNQTWMAENLNYEADGSFCYHNKESNCKEYGRLYTWEEAKMVCPAGWHLPTKEEWGTLLKNVGGKETAGRALKSRHGWNDDGNGFDNYGFSALPAGSSIGGIRFDDAGDRAYFWSASEDSSHGAYGGAYPQAYYMYFDFNDENAGLGGYHKFGGYSVRCLQNSNEERDASLVRPSEAGAANKQNQGSVKDSRDGKTYKTVKIGNQVWMAENLNVKTSEGSWCYDNEPENCENYGRLYTWTAAMDLPMYCRGGDFCAKGEPTLSHRGGGICPKGFHIPSMSEFKILLKATKGRLRANSWVKGDDTFGFSLLPTFGDKLNRSAGLWSSTESVHIERDSDCEGSECEDEYGFDDDDYYYSISSLARVLKFSASDADLDAEFVDLGYSIRCVKDEEKDMLDVEGLPRVEKKLVKKGTSNVETVRIGEQVWMSENLDIKVSKGSWCYGNKPEYCKKYGRLYTWAAAMNLPDFCNKGECRSRVKYPHQGICPSGFHIPTHKEWRTMFDAAGDFSKKVDNALKSSSGWKNNGRDRGNGSDSFGFTILPAGYRDYKGKFTSEGLGTRFWTSDEHYSAIADSWNFYNFGVADGTYKKYNGFSVRCLQNSDSMVATKESIVRMDEAETVPSKSTQDALPEDVVNDLRDGKTYKTVKIGDQVWMAENLNVKTDEGSWCYDNDPENCEKYGRLYIWSAALRACPVGWHLPSIKEFEKLIDFTGGSKALRTQFGWGNEKGLDTYGFSVLSAGLRGINGSFDFAGSGAYFWSASQDNLDYAYGMYLYSDSEDADMDFSSMGYGFSVRCLQDN